MHPTHPSHPRTYSRGRRMRLGALAGAALALLAIASTALAADQTFTIDMKDYSYTPDQMTWHVGDTVTITLTNTSTAKTHEIMFGNGDLNYETDAFGQKHPHGWQTKLFDGPDQVHFVDHSMKGAIEIVD